ncbi:MAG TPA: FAD-binding oxidoreductase [Methylomirabilota bacterium]|jgi:sarcosine oxidase subunit beta|nr:FAD-binding oxidoreductase [Methylomirabilota bacterium]
MMMTADVVIIGGGANGTSTAYHLAALGVKNVVLLERRHLAAGATGKSGSLVRMHYTNDVESRLALESLKVFRDFDAIVGGDCGFRAIGFAQLVGPEHAQALARNVARQQALGIDTRVIPLDDLQRLLPGASLDDVGAAAWEPGSGFADPNATTYAFAAAAERKGVTIVTHCEVSRILTEGGRVSGVETSRGRVSAPAVVAVPGAWAQELIAPLGLDLPLTPQRVQIAIFRWPAGVTRGHPVVIDAVHMSWMRPEGDASTLIGVELGVGHADPEKFDEGVDQSYVALAREKLAARFPPFAQASMRGGWAGMIMMSEDGRPIIDQIPSVPGLWVMLGDSGTSFKTSPAIGKCLAEWIAHGAPRTVDLRPFRSTRFAEGQPWVDPDGYGFERLTISR